MDESNIAISSPSKDLSGRAGGTVKPFVYVDWYRMLLPSLSMNQRLLEQ
jgi:hypothetical protein